MTRPYSFRADLLKKATEIVTKQRNNTYGPPSQDFTRTAEILTAMGFTVGGKPLEAHHVALAMIALKLSRGMWMETHEDTWVDIAGYAACGWECVNEHLEAKAEEGGR